MSQPNQNRSDEYPTASEIVAFAVVELNTPLPYSVLMDMSPSSDLYKAIVERWKCKQDRETERFAILASVVANCNGNKTKPRDFYRPMSEKAIVDEVKARESAMKSMFMRHNARLSANQ